MKTFFLLLTLLSTTMAFAEVPVVVARQVTCQELKDTLHNYGSVKVRSTFLRIPVRTTVHKEVRCSAFEDKATGIFKTKDIRNCHVGFYCVPEIDHHDIPNCRTLGCF